MHGHRVLVVEDDLEIRETLIEVLGEHGYEVVGAADGQEALSALRAGGAQPCLILLDLMMPRMDGRAFREAQVADAALASIPVVVLSAYHDVAENARDMRAAEHLRKPVRLAELLRIMRQHCACAAGDAARWPPRESAS
jgi:CheY-like chemotaxis protein